LPFKPNIAKAPKPTMVMKPDADENTDMVNAG
jgi:hypothetical protein